MNGSKQHMATAGTSTGGRSSSSSSSSSSSWRIWNGVTLLAVIAILMVNMDRRIVGEANDKAETTREESPLGSVGAWTPKTSKPIQWISILGERNSGTRWIYSHVGECFNHSIGVKRYLTRYKHWFQYKNATKYPHDTLVLAQFRNPYEWFNAMHLKPHHSPDHVGLKRWEDFIDKPWTTQRIGYDLNLTKDTLCQEDFQYKDLVSCVVEPRPKSYWKNKKIRYSEHQPFYEMRPDGSGKPFKNLMELRAAKIRNFLEVRNHVGIADVWTIQYEYLLVKGTNHLLELIEERTGVKRQCKAIPPQNRKHRNMSRTFARYLNKHLDWSAEGLVGYTQEDI